MTARFLTDFRQAVSAPRLEKYRPVGGSDLDMLTCYCWNIELAEALFPALAALEVALRNSIHDHITVRENTDQWFWNILRPQDRSGFNTRVNRLHARLGYAPTAGQIVAEQTFGFWTMLLGRNYHQILWTQNRALLLRTTFPNLLPSRSTRKFVEQHYRLSQELRNRVMHHEPIWQGMYWNGRRYELPALHDQLLEGIGWISPALQDTVTISDRFDQVFRTGRTHIEPRIATRLGIST